MIIFSIIQPSEKNGNTETHQRNIRHLEVVRGKGVGRRCSDSTEVKLRGASGGSRECLLVIRVERRSVSQSTCLSARRQKEIMG